MVAGDNCVFIFPTFVLQLRKHRRKLYQKIDPAGGQTWISCSHVVSIAQRWSPFYTSTSVSLLQPLLLALVLVMFVGPSRPLEADQFYWDEREVVGIVLDGKHCLSLQPGCVRTRCADVGSPIH